MPPCHGGDRRFESGRARQSLFGSSSSNKSYGFLGVQVTFLHLKTQFAPIKSSIVRFSASAAILRVSRSTTRLLKNSSA